MVPGSKLPSICKRLFLFCLIGNSLFSFYRNCFFFQAQLNDTISVSENPSEIGCKLISTLFLISKNI